MIAVIAGTNRPDSNTLKVANQVVALLKELGVEVELLDLGKLPPEIFTPASYGEKPPSFAPWQKTIHDAKGIVIVSPEYNGGCPGVLKYFIDMLEHPESFKDKCFAFIGLAMGRWGGVRGVEHLQALVLNLRGYVFPQTVYLPGIANELNEQGEIKDEELLARLRKQLDCFSKFAT